MQYKEIIEFLYGLERFRGMKLGLETTKALLEKLGNPHKELKIIHVAGTNGKGSVCAMLSSILIEAGYKVGMYTSPHLSDFRERFLVDNKKITEDDVIKYFDIVKKQHTNQTYFEFITSMAFVYFKEQKVDFLVLEVGLGGRLDATNVAKPLVSVITSISFDHTKYLGKDIKSVAAEKAGIIKENIPVVTGAKEAALDVIKEIAKEKNSDIYAVSKPIEFPLKLKGDFQKMNASIAVKTIEVLNQKHNLGINNDKIKNGLMKTEWHGRFEFIEKNVLVDCGHNPAAFLELKKEIKKLKFNRLILVIGILSDKNVKRMIEIIEPLADIIVITKPNIARAAEPKEIAKYLKKEHKIIEDAKEALGYAKKTAENGDLVLVTGSIYVVGEVVGSTDCA